MQNDTGGHVQKSRRLKDVEKTKTKKLGEEQRGIINLYLVKTIRLYQLLLRAIPLLQKRQTVSWAAVGKVFPGEGRK